MRTIRIFISLQGEAIIETEGFAGDSCQDASRFIENALGKMLSDRLTAERFQASASQTQDHEHT